jgi:hypothetical protein
MRNRVVWQVWNMAHNVDVASFYGEGDAVAFARALNTQWASVPMFGVCRSIIIGGRAV